MSELKSFESERIYWAVEQVERVAGDVDELHLDDNTFYIKSEADKVIAELEEKHKTEVKELLCLIRDKENNFNRAFDSEEKEIRHQKYKRCLAMAKWCERKRVDSANYRIPREKWEFYDKWYKRWLAIAEKFKTNSTVQ